MTQVLVCGLINIETTLRIERFPLDYYPVTYPFHGVRSTVSGVGYNVAKALTCLGSEVHFCSLIGADSAGESVRRELAHAGVADADVLASLEETPQSVILYDGSGRRQIHVDLKDIQERSYPLERFEARLPGCDAAVLCNINFSRALLGPTRRAGKLIASDVHAISSLDDDYNRDFMQAADVLFLSHENLPAAPEDFARELIGRYGNEVVVVGLGERGALLAMRRDGHMAFVPAAVTRPVVNTIGAGDALFSAFLHTYLRTRDASLALRQAVLFASWKIGVKGAAEGFLSQAELERLAQERASG